MGCNSRYEFVRISHGVESLSYIPFSWGSCRMGCASEDDAGFHFNWTPVLQVWFELPLPEGIRDGLCLARECAEKMNVLHFAFFINDDPDGDRVKRALGEDRIDPRHYVFLARVILDAHRKSPAAGSSRGTGLIGHRHLIHVQEQALQQSRVTAG